MEEKTGRAIRPQYSIISDMLHVFTYLKLQYIITEQFKNYDFH